MKTIACEVMETVEKRKKVAMATTVKVAVMKITVMVV